MLPIRPRENPAVEKDRSGRQRERLPAYTVWGEMWGLGTAVATPGQYDENGARLRRRCNKGAGQQPSYVGTMQPPHVSSAGSRSTAASSPCSRHHVAAGVQVVRTCGVVTVAGAGGRRCGTPTFRSWSAVHLQPRQQLGFGLTAPPPGREPRRLLGSVGLAAFGAADTPDVTAAVPTPPGSPVLAAACRTADFASAGKATARAHRLRRRALKCAARPAASADSRTELPRSPSRSTHRRRSDQRRRRRTRQQTRRSRLLRQRWHRAQCAVAGRLREGRAAPSAISIAEPCVLRPAGPDVSGAEVTRVRVRARPGEQKPHNWPTFFTSCPSPHRSEWRPPEAQQIDPASGEHRRAVPGLPFRAMDRMPVTET